MNSAKIISMRVSKYYSTCYKFLIDEIEPTHKVIKNTGYFSHSNIIHIIILISVAILASSIAFILSDEYFHLVQVHGVSSNEIDLNENGPSTNEAQSSITYENFLKNGYPHPVQHVSKVIDGPAIVFQGAAISKNASENSVTLNKLSDIGTMELSRYGVPNQNISFSSLEGNSFNGTTTFGSDSLNYSGRYVSLNFGNIEKYPETNQISFKFHILGENDTYELILVNGRLFLEGWTNNTSYQKIGDNSSRLVDLANIISSAGDKFMLLDKIQINVENGTIVDSFPFRIDLGNSTINTPGIINENVPYFVDGWVLDKIVSYKYHYLFQDWNFKQILNQEFEVESSDDYVIESSDWKIDEIDELIDNRTGKTIIKLESERNFDSDQLPLLDILQHLNLYDSLIAFGSPKDLLFISVFILIVLFFYPKAKTKG